MINNNINLFCIYAEDVRQETTGQISVIGMFQGGMSVSSTPVDLPKISIIANLFIPSGYKPKSISTTISLNNEELQTTEAPEEFINSLNDSSSKFNSDSHELDGTILQMVAIISPVHIKNTGKIHIQAKIDDTIIKGNPLFITTK